jgi:hypothetical protein
VNRRGWARGLLLFLCVLELGGCAANVGLSRGTRLSHRPSSDELFLSTGGSPYPFRTVGFVHLRVQTPLPGRGQTRLDPAMWGALSNEALGMDGDGVIHIRFQDLFPPLHYKFQDGEVWAGDFGATQPFVEITGEVIQFLQ